MFFVLLVGGFLQEPCRPRKEIIVEKGRVTAKILLCGSAK